MKAIAIIPARYGSSRFAGKPLADIMGKSMIRRVYEQVRQCQGLSGVWVATDDERIAAHLESFGARYCMTSPDLPNGTQRCYRAYADTIRSEIGEADVIVNVQGDEPFIAPQAVEAVVNAFGEGAEKDVVTLVKRITSPEFLFDPNVVKVVLDVRSRALYFSRQAIPFQRDLAKSDAEAWLQATPYFKHIGLYAYRSDVLSRLVALETGRLEKAESLEQLRWLENGYAIYGCETDYESVSVDRPEDIETLKKMWKL
ncbi:MAG: 3-deoxy-manno-octulosonate cytidylyltransferase [Bacteroidales bacterium]|nr:3-deoxy-manno-octulosonate cytidylyltransferase [Bacteroidales bacterium]